MGSLRRLRFRFFLLCLYFFVVLIVTDSRNDPYESRPRIKIKEGHLIFETAANKNITFRSSGGGVINVNGQDLGHLVSLAKTTSSELQGMASTHITELAARLVRLETQTSSFSDTINRFSELRTNFNEVSDKINSILGTGSNKLTPRQVRRAVRKINRLETELDRLTQLLTTNECDSNPCRNGGSCIDSYNGYLCRCPPQWEGVTCESDVNECLRFVGTDLGCQNGATCSNTPGGYSCQCAANWFGVHCTEQHEDCFSASNEALCGHGTCINQPRTLPNQPKYKCFCEQGWTSNGISPACVVDVNECNSPRSPCSASPPVTCINLPGTFHCGQCPAGYSGNGFTCTDINECQTNNGGCSLSPRVQCTNTLGSRVCGPCPPGFNGDGYHCSFVGICHVNNGGCHPSAQCIENTAISGSYKECRCPVGYMGSGTGPSGCIPRTGTTCSSNPCVHGLCRATGGGGGEPSDSLSENFICTCSPGFTGALCEIDVNECLSNPCKNGAHCTNAQNGFTCICTDIWQGNTCEERREACGGRFEAEIGYITYPLNPNTPYAAGRSCVWIITTTPGKVLNFTFGSFHLEVSPTCSFDFLQISDGPDVNSNRIGKYCGTELPKDRSTQGSIVTNTNIAYLWFNSDHSVEGNGFDLTWNSTSPFCGGTLEGADYGAVNSPGYPGVYPHDRDCYWFVTVPLGKRIQFHFATLAIENHFNCSFDFLKVYDGQREVDPVLGNFCNSTAPPPLTTSGSNALLHFHSDDSLSDHGFHVTYSSVPGISGCGGILTREKGSFTSPNFPEAYGNNIECDWLLRVHPKEKIRLSFTTFDLESHSRCAFDYIEIHEGSDERGPLLGRFCGQSMPPLLISTGNSVFVKFRADLSFSGTGFSAEYVTACGGVYEGSSGLVQSPYYPDAYPSNRECVYRIVVPVNHIIQLEFLDFEVENSVDCLFDYLEVRDEGTGNGTALGRLCGHSLPNPITSQLNVIWMKFKTDGSEENKGFSANFTGLDMGCGGVYKNNLGSFTTPNHPTTYTHSSQCIWLIRAPIGFVIRLTFPVFAVEPHSNCDFDYVQITDSNNAVLGKFCGLRPPPAIQSIGNEMLITFKTDESRSHEGFAATYVFINATTACGGNYFAETGVVKSPGFPQPYPPYKECIWIIHAAEGHQLELNVTRFDIETHFQCQYDFLEIRNGGEANSPLIGKFCGQSIPRKITSHSNKLYFQFKSDNSMNGPGFEILFDGTSTGCGGTMTAPTGSIVSPNYPLPYGHDAECNWLIRVSQGSTITLHVVELDIEAHAECTYDYLQVFDGSSDRSPSMAKMCNERQNPGAVTSKRNVMFLKFRTDVSQSGRGFRLTYTTNCTSTLRGYRGIIESPNFPDLYPHNYNCTWTIDVPIGNNITLAFSHLHLEGGDTCQNDYVEVYERNMSADEPILFNRTRQFCGLSDALPPPFNTSSNMAKVRFVSDHWDTYPGFRLEWASVGCGGEFIGKTSGRITSPNYPNGHPVAVSCLWHIRVDIGYKVYLLINDLDIEGDATCYYDYLKVYSGPDHSSHPMTTLCHKQSQPVLLQSSANEMTIELFSDHFLAKKGFSANFSTMRGGCSYSFINAESGSIMTPHYPATYDFDSNCVWFIEVKPMHTIELTLEDIQIPTSINCTENFVQIIDGYINAPDILLKHCGDSLPSKTVFRSSNNTISIRLQVDGKKLAKGFKASYKMVCGGLRVFESYQSGLISSPNYPFHSITIRTCNWTLQAKEPEEKVILTFSQMATYLEREATECKYDYVQVKDGDSTESPLVEKYCGNEAPRPIISTGNALTIEFSGYVVFRATYASGLSRCGGNLNAEKGYVLSPGYPNNYPIDTECIWTISAPQGNLITISFVDFHLEGSDFCNTDYLELREDSDAGPMIGRYCGDDRPALNVTSTNKLWMKFRSDADGSAQGFEARYALKHGVELTGTSGVIDSPGYPRGIVSDGKAFVWRIFTPLSMFVSITFLEMNLPQHYDEECLNSVAILDGGDDSAPEIGRYCDYTIPDPVTSRSNALTVTFNTKPASLSTFRLEWKAVNDRPAAGSTETFEPSNLNLEHVHLNVTGSYELASPGYPFGYGDNYNHSWIVHTLPGHHVFVEVVDMNIEGFENGCHDKVRFYQQKQYHSTLWNLNRTICGRDTPQFHVMSNVIKIDFTTDHSVNLTGFNLRLSSWCGGEIHGPNGIINTQHVTQRTACEWTLFARNGRTIKLTFDQFDIPDSGSTCSQGFIMIRNGGSADSPFLGTGRYCGQSAPVLPETSSNTAFIQFYAHYSSIVSFILRYEEVSVGCGDRLELTENRKSVEIMSPNYPQLPPHDMECDWIISGPPNTNLRVDFEIDHNPSAACNLTYEHVEVYDGGTVISPLIGRYCVPLNESSVKSSTEMMLIRFVTSGTLRLSAFKATVSIDDCGGTYIIPTERYNSASIIVFPVKSGNYSNNMNCRYSLRAQNWIYALRVRFSSIDIASASTDCSTGDFVELRDDDDKGDLIGRYCGRNVTSAMNFKSASSVVFMAFRSDSVDTGKGFTIQVNWASSCGGVIQAKDSGVITSPNYPNSFLHNRHCQWVLVHPRGRQLKLTFTDLNLKVHPRDPDKCLDLLGYNEFRYNRKYYGQSYIPGTRVSCRSPPPATLVFQQIATEITLITHGLGTNEGFRATYDTNDDLTCGGVLDGSVGSSGPIVSQGFGDTSFNETVSCVWVIPGVSSNRTVGVVFDILEVPYPSNMSTWGCRRGVIKFGPNSDTRAMIYYDIHYEEALCGNKTNERPFYAFRPNHIESAWIVLNMNYSDGYRGVSGTYYVQDCGGDIRDPNGNYSSPGYPVAYPPNSLCRWTFSAPIGTQLHLVFVDFELEDNCTNDVVEVTTEGYPKSRIGWFCGKRNPGAIISAYHLVSVVFKSDATGSAKGFRMMVSGVSSGCGGQLTAPDRPITSPNYPSQYSNNVECVWTIDENPNYHLNITFAGRFDLELHATCDHDYVRVEQWINEEWVLINKLCGRTTPQPIRTRSHKARLTFRTNGQITGDGFSFSYIKACGALLTEPQGVIFSPNYPEFYGLNLRCEYLISQPNDYIMLEFEDFGIENGTNCRYDAVDIYLGNDTSAERLGPFCGGMDYKPPTVTSHRQLLLVLTTDYIVNLKGFKANYKISECGGLLIRGRGTFQSPQVTSVKEQNVNCTWVITVASDRAIELKFLTLDINSCYRCSNYCDKVEVRDGPNGTSPLVGRLCGRSADITVPIIKSHSNQMWVQFFFRGNSERSSTQRQGFTASYRTTLGEGQGCGGILEQPSGVIKSPDIDDDGKYDLSLDCNWIIIVNDTKTVKLIFENFNLEESPANLTKCAFDYLEIRDGISPQSPLIDKYCGPNGPDTVNAASNKMFIHFHSDSRESRTGFKLRFSSVAAPCGGLVEAKNITQTLTSPNYPSAYPPSARCRWHFILENHWDNKVSIKFNAMDINCENEDFLEFSVSRRVYLPYRICGQKPPPVVVGSKDLWMTFASGASTSSNTGFSVTYEIASCNQTYVSDSGIIVSPNYPSYWSSSENCLMKITAPAGHFVSLYFYRFGLGYFGVGPNDQCREHNMEIRGGLENSSPILATLCGNSVPDPVFAEGNEVAIHVNSNRGYSLYNIVYTTTDKGKGCGGNITASSGIFTSPLYPFAYSRSADCRWSVRTYGIHSMTLQFTAFSFSSTVGCETNYVEVYEGFVDIDANKVTRYCGNDVPAPYRSRGSEILVKMVTSTNNTGLGFSATFTSNMLDIEPGPLIASATRSALMTRDGAIHFDDAYNFGYN